MRRHITGFTLIESVVVIAVIAILATIGVVMYNGAQKRADDARAFVTAQQATTALEAYFVKNKDYPPNLAGVNYAGPTEVALVLYTNAPTTRVYPPGVLSPEQNAQLLLNSCNNQMPTEEGGTVYNTGCKFAGNNVLVKGKAGSQVNLHGPTMTRDEFLANYAADCSMPVCLAARDAMLAAFEAQGGVFPLTVPKNNVTMPEATTVATDNATEYCLESRSVDYVDVAYHKTQADSDVVDGTCPDNPDLYYIP